MRDPKLVRADDHLPLERRQPHQLSSTGVGMPIGHVTTPRIECRFIAMATSCAGGRQEPLPRSRPPSRHAYTLPTTLSSASGFGSPLRHDRHHEWETLGPTWSWSPGAPTTCPVRQARSQPHELLSRTAPKDIRLNRVRRFGRCRQPYPHQAVEDTYQQPGLFAPRFRRPAARPRRRAAPEPTRSRISVGTRRRYASPIAQAGSAATGDLGHGSRMNTRTVSAPLLSNHRPDRRRLLVPCTGGWKELPQAVFQTRPT